MLNMNMNVFGPKPWLGRPPWTPLSNGSSVCLCCSCCWNDNIPMNFNKLFFHSCCCWNVSLQHSLL